MGTMRYRSSLFALIFCAPGLASSQPTSDATDQLGNLLKQGSSLLGRLFNDKPAQLEELVNKKQFDEAARFLEQEKDYFKENEGKHEPQIRLVVDKVYEPIGRVFRDSDGAIKPGASANKEKWPALKVSIKASQDAIQEFDRLPYVGASRFRPTEPEEFKTRLSAVTEELQRDAPKAFAAFDHTTGASFFDAYPLELSNNEFLNTNVQVLVEQADKSGDPQKVVTIAHTYGSLLSDSAKARLGDKYADLKLASNAGAGFYEKLDAIFEARDHGLRTTTRDGYRVLISQVEPPTKPDYSVEFEFATATPVVTAVPAEIMRRAGSQNYVVALVPKRTEISRRVISKEEKSSTVKTGTRSLPNPAYAQAQANVFRAENAARNQEINNLRPQYSPYGALLQGLASGLTAATKQNAYDELNSTPMTIEEPVYRSYRYSISNIAVQRKTEAYLVVLDKERQTASVTTHQFNEERKFSVPYGLHDEDPNYYSLKARLDAEDAVEQFERSSAKVKFLDAVSLIRKERKPFTAIEDGAAYLASLTPTPGTTGADIAAPTLERDPRFQSVVVVLSGRGGYGTGFFVEPNLVMTNFHVIEGSNLAEVRFANGKETLGKVVKTDVGLDLALIRVQETGQPLAFYNGALRQGDSVDVLGHPKQMAFTLTRGIVSAIRRGENPGARGGAPVTYVQTDASINPGNSGGPVIDATRATRATAGNTDRGAIRWRPSRNAASERSSEQVLVQGTLQRLRLRDDSSCSQRSIVPHPTF